MRDIRIQARRGLKHFGRMRGIRARFRTVPQRAQRRALLRVIRGPTQGVEVKFYDKGLVAATLTTSTNASGGEHDPSATIMMNTVTQGDGESQRDGRRITMKSIYIVGLINCAKQAAQSSGDNATNIFIALVLDTQTNAAQLASENVFANPGGTALLGTTPFRNLRFTQRFKVLKTMNFTMSNSNLANDTGATGGVIAQGLERRFKMFVNLNVVTNFTASTESVVDIPDTSLHFIAWCSDTGLAPKLSYSSRLRFVG